jgi:hypothetical protein
MTGLPAAPPGGVTHTGLLLTEALPSCSGPCLPGLGAARGSQEDCNPGASSEIINPELQVLRTCSSSRAPSGSGMRFHVACKLFKDRFASKLLPGAFFPPPHAGLEPL